jgi:hypothetical protein
MDTRIVLTLADESGCFDTVRTSQWLDATNETEAIEQACLYSLDRAYRLEFFRGSNSKPFRVLEQTAFNF